MNNATPVDTQLRRPVTVAIDAPHAGVGAPTEDGFGSYVRIIWSAAYRSRYLILGIVVATMIVAMIATLLMHRTYRATASVQVEQQTSKVLGDSGAAELTPTESVFDADRFFETQLDILQSRAVRIRVMEALGLLNGDNFLRDMGADLDAKPIGNLTPAQSKREQVLGLMREKLSVDLPHNSRIVRISFDSPDAALAARVANSYAQNFIMSNLSRRFDTSSYARNFLQGQLSEAKRRLEDSDRAIVDYAREARLIDASAGTAGTADSPIAGPRSLTTSNLVQINNAYSTARAERIEAQQRWQQASRTPLMNLPEVLGNLTIQGLLQNKAQAEASYQQDAQRRRADFPSMRQQAALIAEYDRQITTLATSIRNSIRDHYVVALKEEQALGGNVNQLKVDTLAEQDRSVRYNILKRDSDTNRTMYEGLLQRYKEVSAAAGITANNLTQIDTAEAPALPISPRPLLNLALSGLLGLLFAGIAVFAREKFDDVIRSPDDVSQKLGLMVLNSTPLLPNGVAPEEALGDPRSALSEAYYALRTSLELSTSTGLPRALLITSGRESEGKSTTAYAIARDFARIGKRVVLIDSDLRRPSLHRTLGLSNARGLSSVLARAKTLEEAVQPTDIENLGFLAAGPLPPNPAQLLSSGALPELIAELQGNHDLIVIDGPPVLGLADAVLLASNVEATIFVVEANGSHNGHAKASIRRLHMSGVNVIGAVLTKFDARLVGYGGYYGYNYNYAYGRNESDAA